MAGRKLFRGGLFGFRRKDVNSYIQSLISEQEEKLSELTDMLEKERKRNGELVVKNDELFKQFESMTQRTDVLNSENERQNQTISALNADIADKSSKIFALELELAKTNNLLELAKEENAVLSRKSENIIAQYAQTPAALHIKQSAEDFLTAAREKVEETLEQSKAQAQEFLASVADRVKPAVKEEPMPETTDVLKPETAEMPEPENKAEEVLKERSNDTSKDALERFKALLNSGSTSGQDDAQNPKGDWRDFFLR